MRDTETIGGPAAARPRAGAGKGGPRRAGRNECKKRNSGMHRSKLALAALGMAALVSGCADTALEERQLFVGADPQRLGPFDTNDRAGHVLLSAEAERRLVFVRRHPQTGKEVYCTAPQADTAQGLEILRELKLGLTTPEGTEVGDGEFKDKAVKNVFKLSEPNDALLAMRDFLFIACEAYANDAIPKAEYRRILYTALISTVGATLISEVRPAVTAGGESAGGARADHLGKLIDWIIKKEKEAQHTAGVIDVNALSKERALEELDKKEQPIGKEAF